MSEILKGKFQRAKNCRITNEGRIENSDYLQQIMEIFICSIFRELKNIYIYYVINQQMYFNKIYFIDKINCTLYFIKIHFVDVNLLVCQIIYKTYGDISL